MTKEEALDKLSLSIGADKEEIVKTYKKLVRRYPPEFNPDKFKEIDEAYRFLTSFPIMLEWLLSSETNIDDINYDLFSKEVSPPTASLIDKSLAEAKQQLKMAHLWHIS
ncbi:Heat shock protein DnaJ [Candidatus Magnetoovum chiemensis]|nr:Heat shock protein DnaJ [Candidatus Magnetoovum chiemensis]